MANTKISQEHEECIGCGSCIAVCPEFWEMGQDGKAKPRKGEKKGKSIEFEIDEKDLACNQEAADICPAQCIKING